MDAQKQASFFLRHLRMLPPPYQSADNQRMTLGFFCLSALDLLGVLDKVKGDERDDIIDWVYEQQLPRAQGGGFRASPCFGPLPTSDTHEAGRPFVHGAKGHLAMTYTALLILGMLRDDFTRLDKEGIIQLLHSSQQADGRCATSGRSANRPAADSTNLTFSFLAGADQIERDVRFTFCAFAVACMTGAWSSIDVDSALAFVERCQSYESGFAQAPTQEAHGEDRPVMRNKCGQRLITSLSPGGSTYCVVAAYSLSGRLSSIPRKAELTRWLLSRQQPGTGFNGRVQKPTDTCYSFWCGAALAMLGRHDAIDGPGDVEWIVSNQTRIGGFSKLIGENPDALHSYMGLAALAMHREAGLAELDPALNVSGSTKDWIQSKLADARNR